MFSSHLCSCFFSRVKLMSNASAGVTELIILGELRINEFVFFEHNVSNHSHVSFGFGFFVLHWLPMIIPEKLIWSEHWILFVSNNSDRRHTSRNVESSVKSTIERLWFNAPNIIISEGVWLNRSQGLESS